MIKLKHKKSNCGHSWYNDILYISMHHGTFLIMHNVKGWEYIIQFSTVKPWWFPKKDSNWMNGEYTLYGWLFVYVGHANTKNNLLRGRIAKAYNANIDYGLELMERYFLDSKEKTKNLICQYHNIKNGTHYCPDIFYKELNQLLALYCYNTEQISKDSPKTRITGYGRVKLKQVDIQDK